MSVKASLMISVILPVADNDETLAATIDSVLTQSHANLELIIINDGSTDQSAKIINAYATKDKRIKTLLCKVRSGGPARPRNLGLQQAQGELLAFVDADDVWHPIKLETQLKHLDAHDFDFISSDCVRFNADETLDLTLAIDPSPTVTTLNHESMLRKNRVITSSMLIKTKKFRELGFNEHADHIGIEDYLAWLNLLQNPKIRGAILHLPLVFYRLSSDSLSASKIKMARKIYKLLSNYQIDGRKLGAKKLFYFICYIVIAIKNRIGAS